MTKRIVSLTLSLIMVLSLFTGLSFPAGAEEETPTVTYTYEKADAVQENDEVVLVCEGDGFLYELSEANGFGAEHNSIAEIEGTFVFSIIEVDGAYAFKYTDNSDVAYYLRWPAGEEKVSLGTTLDSYAYWTIEIDEDNNSNAVIKGFGGSYSISYSGGAFVCYAQAGLPVQLYKRTAVSSVEEPDSAEDIHIYFVDQTKSENTSIYFAQSETPENLTVINTEAVGETSADSGDEEGFLAGKAYTDEVGLVNYYTLDQKMEGDETWVFFAAGGKNTVGLPFKTDAIEATGGAHDKEKYVVYNITEVNGKLTATIANDVWPEDTAVVVAPTCTESGNITYTGTYTGRTKVAFEKALGHDWGAWAVVDGCLKRSCARCDAVEEKQLDEGYYLIIGTDWIIEEIEENNKFVPNPGATGEHMLSTTLKAGDQIKVVHVTNYNIDAWYPDGIGTQYTVDAAHAGLVTIYFKTSYDNAWSDFGGYFYINKVASSNITSSAVDFNGKMYLITFIKLSDEVMADANAYVRTTFNGVSTDHSVAQLKLSLDDQGRVRVQQEMFAAMMRDEMTLQVFNGAGEAQPLTYRETTDVTDGYVNTALKYLKGRQENSSNPAMRELAWAAELYGIAVQVKFGYKLDQLTPRDIAAMETEAARTLIPASYAEVLSGNLPEGISKRTKTVLFEADNSLRQFFYINDEDIGNYTFTLNGKTVQPVRFEAGKYNVDQPNIASGLLSTEYTFAVSNGTDTYTICSSALGYAYDRQEKSADPKMVNLAKLLYCYSQAANAYFSH